MISPLSRNSSDSFASARPIFSTEFCRPPWHVSEQKRPWAARPEILQAMHGHPLAITDGTIRSLLNVEQAGGGVQECPWYIER